MKISLTRAQYEHVVENLDSWAMDEATVRRDYSGRGMYGRTCVGVTHTGGAAVPAAFLYFLADELGEDFLDVLADLGGGAVDSMGLSTIHYWPGLTVEEFDDEDEEEE